MALPISFEPSVYRLCWIRDSYVAGAQVDLGTELTPNAIAPALAGLTQAASSGSSLFSEEMMTDALGSSSRCSLLPVAAKRQLVPMLGPMNTEQQLQEARDNFAVLARVASRIRAAGARSKSVELHLPYIDRRGWGKRFEILDSLQFVAESGRILPREFITNPQRLTAHQAFLAACPSADSCSGFSLAGAGKAISAMVCATLQKVPAEKHPSYFPILCAMTVTIQRTMRQWVEQSCLATLHRFADAERSWPVLAYITSPPFPGKRPDTFVHDPMRPDWIHAVLRGCRPTLRSLLAHLQGLFESAGMEETAKLYTVSETKNVLAYVRRQRRMFQNLVLQETAIVNAFVAWVSAVRKAVNSRQIASACEELAGQIHSCIRRLPDPCRSEELGSLLLVEALHALHCRLGGTQRMEAVGRREDDVAARIISLYDTYTMSGGMVDAATRSQRREDSLSMQPAGHLDSVVQNEIEVDAA